jgi:hypothetical protein
MVIKIFTNNVAQDLQISMETLKKCNKKNQGTLPPPNASSSTVADGNDSNSV